jgi:hypothetical protein
METISVSPTFYMDGKSDLLSQSLRDQGHMTRTMTYDKKDPIAYAAWVRSRKPEMQVKRLQNEED